MEIAFRVLEVKSMLKVSVFVMSGKKKAREQTNKQQQNRTVDNNKGNYDGLRYVTKDSDNCQSSTLDLDISVRDIQRRKVL